MNLRFKKTGIYLRYLFLFILFINSFTQIHSQNAFNWTELSEMPEPVSNNAVCSAFVNDTHYVFSFCGIDSTKIYSGIHLKSWRYNVEADRWDSIAPVPDTLGKIGVAASFVNGKIFVIGGYHVLQNGNEITSNKVHVFNPLLNIWETDAAPLIYPIDDHVQAVYKDSLIYVITGWSNSGSFPYTQIFNPFNNTWYSGTNTPNTGIYKCFGASGNIIGDSIYYYGGASGSFSFTAQPFLRKGIIDPSDPTQITWTQLSNSPGDAGYRCAPFYWENQLFWIGGAGVAYNYDGIAYNGSGGVNPVNRILQYDPELSVWTAHSPTPFSVMDLRGSGMITPGNVIICGGMENNQKTSSKTFLIHADSSVLGLNEINLKKTIILYPNPAYSNLVINSKEYQSYEIYDMYGNKIISSVNAEQNIVDISFLKPGHYLVRITSDRISRIEKFIKM